MVYTIMWKFKSCSRCGGDISIDKDMDGWYEQCLQCGYIREIPSAVEVHQHSGDNEEKPVTKLHSGYPVEV